MQVDARFTSDLATFVKLCCGGVSPPLASTYVGVIADSFLVITASFACFHRPGPRITAFACELVPLAVHSPATPVRSRSPLSALSSPFSHSSL